MIQTERLLLRTLTQNDLAAFYDFYQLPEVCRYLLNEPWTEANKSEQFQKKLENNHLSSESSLTLGIEYNQQVIGEMVIMPSDMSDSYEIGYVLTPQFSQKGFATEALKGTINYLFKHVKAHRVYANLDARNVASAKLCEKVGMRQEAHFIQDFWSKGEWTDSYIYAILRSEWH